MSPRDDDLFETEAEVDAVGGGAGRYADRSAADPGPDAVTQFLTDLRSLADGPAPAPSAELLAAFGGAVPLASRRRPARRVLAAAAAVAVLGGTGVAAARNQLPEPAQRLVSRVVDVLTPFHLDPADRVAPKPAPNVPALPLPSQSPTPAAPAGPGDTPDPSGTEDHRGGTPSGSEDGTGAGSGSEGGTDGGTGSSSGGSDSGSETGSGGSDSGSTDSGSTYSGSGGSSDGGGDAASSTPAAPQTTAPRSTSDSAPGGDSGGDTATGSGSNAPDASDG